MIKYSRSRERYTYEQQLKRQWRRLLKITMILEINSVGIHRGFHEERKRFSYRLRKDNASEARIENAIWVQGLDQSSVSKLWSRQNR